MGFTKAASCLPTSRKHQILNNHQQSGRSLCQALTRASLPAQPLTRLRLPAAAIAAFQRLFQPLETPPGA